MDIEEFFNKQTMSAYNLMMRKLLDFYQSNYDVHLLSALLTFSHLLEQLEDDENGISVNDIKDLLKESFNEDIASYLPPIKKKDQHAEIQLLKGVIFIKYARTSYKLKNYDELMHCLKTAFECFGASQVFKSDNLITTLDDDYKFTVASKGGKVKAEKEAEKKAPIFKKLEKFWDKENWTAKGRGKYVKFADWAIHSEENEGLPHETIRKHISKYDKRK